MSQPKPPRVLLFDIGGVCVISPFQGILDYEKTNNIPIGYINYSISATSPNGSWHRLERGEIPLDSTFFQAFKIDLENSDRWREYHATLQVKESCNPVTALPPVPSINTTTLFYSMILPSRQPDPHMFPALEKLKSARQFTLAALSNTVIFPPDHPLTQPTESGPLRHIFDVFVSSAHVGMRKPDPRIYEYTMEKLRERVGDDLRPEEVLFLDDIGANLKPARALGWRTLRVVLGKTDEAVRELGEILQMDLSRDSQGRAKI